MYALEHRRELSDRWAWMLFAGVLDILIAAMIIAGLAGLGGMGAWTAGRHQSAVRRRDLDRRWRSPRAKLTSEFATINSARLRG